MKNILNKNIDDILSEKYLAYAISTIISRSLPDLRDGLKPVHRRIIYSMYQLKLFKGSSFKKSARIVGDVMGKFHPHGDQAIYDSLVRLAQEFSTRVPLIEGQGNFGNIDGDNAAAMRYTEARLENIANYFFDGLEENSVDLKENYDGQNLEPSVLPSQLPNILLNGSSGIAVGMATNIPPHNIFELNNALIELIKKPEVSLSKLLKIVLGPDLPTGGVAIIPPDEQKQIYKTGKGAFNIRANYFIENLKNGTYQIIITDIPYQVNKSRLIEQIANLIVNKKIPLDDIYDESDENIRIVLKPKNRNIDSHKLIELCFKVSDLSIRYSCNFNVLVDGTYPKLLGLKEILNNFINYRYLTIKRKSQFNIERINKRLDILKGYLIVYKFIDTIIKIIRTKENPKKIIIKKYKLKDIQADAILNMRLGSLKKLDEYETKNEIKRLNEELKLLKKLIKNKSFLSEYLVNEIKKINHELKDEIYKRKTKILIQKDIQEDINFDEFETIEKLTIVIDKEGFLKSYKDHLPIDQIKKNQKNINDIFHIQSNDKLLIFVSSGGVFTVNPNELPSGKSNPKSYIYFIETGSREKLVGVLVPEENRNCLLSSLNGKGFIVDSNSLISNQKKGKKLFNLKISDILIKVLNVNKKYIAITNKSGKLLIFNIESLPILQKGSGVQLIKLKKNELIADIKLLDQSEGLTWFSGSKIKKLNDISFWIGKRAQSGKKVPKYFNKNFKFE